MECRTQVTFPCQQVLYRSEPASDHVCRPVPQYSVPVGVLAHNEQTRAIVFQRVFYSVEANTVLKYRVITVYQTLTFCNSLLYFTELRVKICKQ